LLQSASRQTGKPEKYRGRKSKRDGACALTAGRGETRRQRTVSKGLEQKKST